MIVRTMQEELRRAAGILPVVTVTGPRQSGKTTLCRQTFPDLPYTNLEQPDVRRFAADDPRGFLDAYPDGAVIDEIQKLPELLSFIQIRVDESGRNGEFVLTGSQNFGLLTSISQSLAGRTAVLHLLPCAREEVNRFPDPPCDLLSTLLVGGYPRLFDQGLERDDWMPGYVATYLERDVRQIKNIGDLTTFQTFLEMAAGHVGQVLNLSAFGSVCGIAQATAKAWLSVLEAGYIAFRLPPLHRNLKKRLTRRPKLYFYDTGLVCYLLGIRTTKQLATHPLRGPIFECWAVSEIAKARVHRGLRERLFFYRDHKGEEVDLVLDLGTEMLAAEMKAGKTVPSDAFRSLHALARLATTHSAAVSILDQVLIYGGEELQRRSAGTVLPWHEIANYDWAPDRPQRG